MTIRKVVAVGGVPGCGKSTLLKRLYQRLQARCGPEYTNTDMQLAPLLVGSQFAVPNKKILYFMLGVGYHSDDMKFPGTDMLSMAVQPEAVKFLQRLEDEPMVNASVLFEGDRLFNNSFLTTVEEMVGDRLSVVFLNCSEEVLKARRGGREDTQTPEFHKSRMTKYRNIEMNLSLMSLITRLPNNTDAHFDRNVIFLEQEMVNG